MVENPLNIEEKSLWSLMKVSIIFINEKKIKIKFDSNKDKNLGDNSHINKINYENYIDKLEIQIGTSLINDHEMIIRDYMLWIDIFNQYKRKIIAFNSFVKSSKYKDLFIELRKEVENLREKVTNNRIREDRKVFLIKLKIQVDKHGKDYFIDICNIIFNFSESY